GGHDNGYRRGGLLGRQRCRRSPRYDHIDLEAEQLCRQLGKKVGLSLGGAVLDEEISPLDISEIPQLVDERYEIVVLCSRSRLKHTHAIDLGYLLRPSTERPRARCSAQKGDEFPSVHLAPTAH